MDRAFSPVSAGVQTIRHADVQGCGKGSLLPPCFTPRGDNGLWWSLCKTARLGPALLNSIEASCQAANKAAFSAQTLIRGCSIWPAHRAPDFRRLSGERLRLFIF